MTLPQPHIHAGDTVEAASITAPPRRTTWTLRQNIARLIWSTASKPLWAFLPPARASLLRIFGASVGPGCRFGRGVDIIIPWNLRIGRDVQVGDRCTLYALGVITIGDATVLDYKAHLCAGTHDMADPAFPLLTPPITIGRGSFIGVDAFIGPNVTLGDRCKVMPRASVYASFPDDSMLTGNPARAADALPSCPAGVMRK